MSSEVHAMNDKKFIITKDQKTANVMIANGFQLVSNIGDIYTFINEPSKHFIFADNDKKLICYTNNLHI